MYLLIQQTQQHLGLNRKGYYRAKKRKITSKKIKTLADNRNQESSFFHHKVYKNTHVKLNPDRKHAKNARNKNPKYANRKDIENLAKKSTIRMVDGSLWGIMNRRSPTSQRWSGSHYRRS